MRKLMIGCGLLAAGLLGGCQNGQITPQAKLALTNLCQQDQALQPLVAGAASGVAGAVGGKAGAGATLVIKADTAFLHPSVQAACAQLEATSVVPATAPATTPPAAATVTGTSGK